jgi:hypothetical protein
MATLADDGRSQASRAVLEASRAVVETSRAVVETSRAVLETKKHRDAMLFFCNTHTGLIKHRVNLLACMHIS